jgi:hypothetical protein
MVNEQERAADGLGRTVSGLVMLSTALTTGLGGVYMTTRSVVVTTLVAGVVAVLGTTVVLRHRPHRSGEATEAERRERA